MPRPMRRARSAASLSCGTAGTYVLASTTLSRKCVESTLLSSSLLQSTAAIRRDVLGQVDGAEAAVFVRPEPLLAAWICRFQLIQMRHGICAIGRVQEQHARLAVVMRVLDDLVEEVARANDLPHFAVTWSDQLEITVVLDRPHERVGDADRDVEVGDLVFAGLAADEVHDIGVIHTQHGHVGAACDCRPGPPRRTPYRTRAESRPGRWPVPPTKRRKRPWGAGAKTKSRCRRRSAGSAPHRAASGRCRRRAVPCRRRWAGQNTRQAGPAACPRR